MLCSLFSVYTVDAQAVHDGEGAFANGNAHTHRRRKRHRFATIPLLFLALGNGNSFCEKAFSASDAHHNHTPECKQGDARHKYELWHNLAHLKHPLAEEGRRLQPAKAKEDLVSDEAPHRHCKSYGKLYRDRGEAEAVDKAITKSSVEKHACNAMVTHNRHKPHKTHSNDLPIFCHPATALILMLALQYRDQT